MQENCLVFVLRGPICLPQSTIPWVSMPKGPQGQKRPADVIGNAVRVMRIATSEETDHRQAVAGCRRDRAGVPRQAYARREGEPHSVR
jgi:hypothetical protein